MLVVEGGRIRPGVHDLVRGISPGWGAVGDGDTGRGGEVGAGTRVAVHYAATLDRIDEVAGVGDDGGHRALGPMHATIKGLEHHVGAVVRRPRATELLGEHVHDAVAVRADSAAAVAEAVDWGDPICHCGGHLLLGPRGAAIC